MTSRWACLSKLKRSWRVGELARVPNRKTENRIAFYQPDFLFMIVKRSADWKPEDPNDVPTGGEVLSVEYVASFVEARDDLLRCNKIALEHNLDKWAVIQCPDGGL